MWCPDRMGGADAAEGPDAAGLSDTFGYIFVLGNTFFVLAVCLRKIISNFLKLSLFSLFLTFLSGVPDAAGLSDTFLVLEILVEKNYLKFSQIFSAYIFMYWQWRKIISNFLFVPGGVQWWEGTYRGGMQGYMFSICCF